MKIFIASEFRCTIYQKELYLAPKAYTIYNRYAEAFGDIVLCSRFETVESLIPGYRKADFIRDTIHINSLLGTLNGKYNHHIEEKMGDCELVILRLPSLIAYRAADFAKKMNKPLLAECMGDAWDGYWNHDIIGKIIAPYMFIKMKKIVSDADYALYVTERFLQKRYPCSNKSINASNVVINNTDPHILESRRKKINEMNPLDIALMTTAGVDVHAKGHEYVLGAMSKLKRKGYKIKYYLAGGGDQTRLKKIAIKYGVLNDVVFLGELPMNKIYEYIDIVDIYIQPSLQEGLPRAVIEAMSRACPCLGSNTAGTPELLDAECIFKRKSTDAIVNCIEFFLKRDLYKYAVSNYQRASQYKDNVLSARRNEYFDYVRNSIINT